MTQPWPLNAPYFIKNSFKRRDWSFQPHHYSFCLHESLQNKLPPTNMLAVPTPDNYWRPFKHFHKSAQWIKWVAHNDLDSSCCQLWEDKSVSLLCQWLHRNVWIGMCDNFLTIFTITQKVWNSDRVTFEMYCGSMERSYLPSCVNVPLTVFWEHKRNGRMTSMTSMTRLCGCSLQCSSGYRTSRSFCLMGRLSYTSVSLRESYLHLSHQPKIERFQRHLTKHCYTHKRNNSPQT